jgi:hypothetical protein
MRLEVVDTVPGAGGDMDRAGSDAEAGAVAGPGDHGKGCDR